jgi:HlyD family secretion protein
VNFSVDAFPYRTFKGKVSQVRYGAITNQNVINYDCVIEVNNSDLKLLPGMTANVSVISAERNNVLKIPNAALRFRPPESIGTPSTNAGAQFTSQGSSSSSGSGPRQGGGGSGGGGGGPRAGGARGGGSGRPRGERQLTRTVYVLPENIESKDGTVAKPKPVSIKVGISDGISTEVLDGLEEGAQVVTGMLSGEGDGRPSRPSSPFGGGFRRF